MWNPHSRKPIGISSLALLAGFWLALGTATGVAADDPPSSFTELLALYPQVDSLLQTVDSGESSDRVDEFVFQGAASYKPYATELPPPSRSDDSDWVYSPDRSMAASVMFYAGEPDNALTLFNRGGDGAVEILEFCGTPCQYLGVVWLDTRTLAMAQLQEHYHMPGYRVVGFDLVVSVYRLKDTTVTGFLLPPPKSPIKLPDLMRKYPKLDSVAGSAFVSFARPAYSDFEKLPTQAIDFRGTPWPPSPDTASDSGWLYSPDRRRAVTIRDYRAPFTGDLDVILVSYNRQGNGKVELLVYGRPSNIFHDVVWLDNQRFVFFASQAYYEKQRVFAPTYSVEISLFDLADSTRVEWRAPGVK